MSDEKEKEKVEKELDTIEHWSHRHPLTLVKVKARIVNYCYCCQYVFSSGEEAYGCSIKGCGYVYLLHEQCAEMARKIRYPIAHNPQHILTLRLSSNLRTCEICRLMIWSMGYDCTSCGFQMHMRCAHAGGGVIDVTTDDDEQSRNISHPSHPQHELKLLRKFCSFNCDACGTSRGKGTSYTCTAEACQYWIHERCASLPETIQREDHHHSLSLSFHFPLEYIKYGYKCDVCSKHMLIKKWIYHCQLCSVFVHLKCAFDKSSRTRTLANVAKDIIQLPTNDVAEELIAPFVMRQGGAIPHDDVMNEKYNFPHHRHQLTLISSHHHQNKEEEEEEDDDDDDDDDDGKRSDVLICNGCISPIFPSSSSYMSCSSEDCNYNLHMACFHLPHELPSHPFHLEKDHHLILQSSFDKLQPWEFKKCSVCEYPTNGLYYACTKCNWFRVDIKCASLEDNIYHAAHPQHLLNYVTKMDIFRHFYNKLDTSSCAAGCGYGIYDYDCYTSNFDFIVHVRCALLPASVSSRKWDNKHQLLLTYDANLNHPGDFYCNQCEEQMNPKSWMYHCRNCDISFHPKCFLATSGCYRNIKFGQQYVIDAAHPHTLTFQLLTRKRRCDLCHRDMYEKQGFQCASCNFFICLYDCGKDVIKMVAFRPSIDRIYVGLYMHRRSLSILDPSVCNDYL